MGGKRPGRQIQSSSGGGHVTSTSSQRTECPSAAAIRSWKPWSSVSKSNGDWDQKRMSRYLADARMQQGALILLNEFLMIKNADQFHTKRQKNTSTVMQQELATRKLREANPGINIPPTVYGEPGLSRQPVKPVFATTYDQSFAFDNMLVNSEAYRRSMGIPPSAAARSQPSQSSPGPSKPTDVKREKEDSQVTPDDDELPEYTPYPEDSTAPPVDEYIPNPRAVFQSYGVPKPIPQDRIPPVHVPDCPSSLPLTTNPSQLNFTIPIHPLFITASKPPRRNGTVSDRTTELSPLEQLSTSASLRWLGTRA